MKPSNGKNQRRLTFELTLLDGKQSDKFLVTLPGLGYQYRNLKGHEVRADFGLDDQVVLDWMVASGIDVDRPEVKAEATAFVEMARGAFRGELKRFVNEDYFTGKPEEVKLRTKHLEDWKSFAWFGAAWVVGMLTIASLDTFREYYPQRAWLVRCGWVIVWLSFPLLTAIGPWLYWCGNEWIATISTGDRLRRSPVLLATLRGDENRVRRLLGKGLSADEDNPLFWSAAIGDHRILRRLLVSNAEVDQGYLSEITPLMIASALGHTEVVRMLILAGANVDAQDVGYSSDALFFASDGPLDVNYTWPGQRQSSLMLAAQGGFVDVVDLLLEAGAQTDLRDADGRTALMIAEQEGRNDIVAKLSHALSSTRKD